MGEKLDPLAFGYSAGILSAGTIFLLGAFGNMGFYSGAMKMMQQSHMFFSPANPFGVLAGIVEAAILGFIIGYLFAAIYNKFAK